MKRKLRSTLYMVIAFVVWCLLMSRLVGVQQPRHTHRPDNKVAKNETRPKHSVTHAKETAENKAIVKALVKLGHNDSPGDRIDLDDTKDFLRRIKIATLVKLKSTVRQEENVQVIPLKPFQSRIDDKMVEYIEGRKAGGGPVYMQHYTVNRLYTNGGWLTLFGLKK